MAHHEEHHDAHDPVGTDEQVMNDQPPAARLFILMAILLSVVIVMSTGVYQLFASSARSEASSKSTGVDPRLRELREQSKQELTGEGFAYCDNRCSVNAPRMANAPVCTTSCVQNQKVSVACMHPEGDTPCDTQAPEHDYRRPSFDLAKSKACSPDCVDGQMMVNLPCVQPEVAQQDADAKKFCRYYGPLGQPEVAGNGALPQMINSWEKGRSDMLEPIR